MHQMSSFSDKATNTRIQVDPNGRLKSLGLFVLTASLLLAVIVFLAPSSALTQSSLASLSYLEDPANALEVSDVLAARTSFSQAEKETLNFGLTSSAYWVWVTLNRPENSVPKLYVEMGYPHLDVLEVYGEKGGQFELQYRLGDSVGFKDRPVKDRTWVIPVEFAPQQATIDILIRTQSQGSIQLPFIVHTNESYHLSDRNEQLVLGLYYGILFGLLAYNLLLVLGTRERVYVDYCAYAGCQMLFQFSQNGLSFEYFWPEATQWHQVSIPFFASLSLLFCTRFTRVFLNIEPLKLARLFKTFLAIEGTFIALALASFIVDKSLVITLVSLAVTVAGVFMLSVAVYIYLTGERNARLYLLAWGVLLFGIIIYAAKTLGLLPESFITEYSVQIGSVIEMVLLSYALAERFNRLKNENIRVQEEASATLENNVAIRTRELGDALAKLEKAHTQLESSAKRDPLTNIYNRRHFNRVLDESFNEANASNGMLSLIIIDIDFFKKINDTMGHLVGDEVIVGVATTLDSHCAGTHYIPARFGGEEFVVLLPSCDGSAAFEFAESIRHCIAGLMFTEHENAQKGIDNESACDDESSDATFGITVSLGVSSFEHATDSSHNGLKLIDRADQALYQAKNLGRNQTQLYRTEDGPDSQRAA